MPKKTFRAGLRRIFVGFTRFTPKMRRDLKKLGGEVVRQDGGHSVVRFVKDGRTHTFSVSCTPSDKREGYNVVSDIMRSMYAEQ